MASRLRSLRRLYTGGTLIAGLLVTAFGLVAWLGYEALDAAASHRRTAESVLRDYALVSATQLASSVRSELDDVIDEVLVPVLRRSRSEGAQPPSAVGRELDDGAREAGCECPSLRTPLLLFRADPSGEVRTEPDTVSAQVRSRLSELVMHGRPPAGDDPVSRLLTAPPGDLLDQAVAIGFLASDDRGEPIFGFVVPTAALEELFREWYDDDSLLPEAIVGDLPNDSVLQVAIEDPSGATVFASSASYATAPGASVTIPDGARFGNLVVRAAVRQDAASRLIIGGLPNSRLPLLVVLLLLTLGVGAAAFVQLRREQGFQRLREDFISSVSHELRTPLAQIRMFSELQEAGKLPSPDDQKRATSVISREARRLSHLVDNILQFSRLRRTWGQGMPPDRLELGEAIADGLDSVTPLLEAHDMRLDLSIDPGVWVHANGEALTRVIVNLLDNAIKYGPSGQTIRVGVRRADDVARLSVADEGPGIPVADRERIWKAYRRLDRDVKAQVPGSGIGLSVVSELVSLHGGRVQIDEPPGGGARFIVELPLAAKAGSANGAAEGKLP